MNRLTAIALVAGFIAGAFLSVAAVEGLNLPIVSLLLLAVAGTAGLAVLWLQNAR